VLRSIIQFKYCVGHGNFQSALKNTMKKIYTLIVLLFMSFPAWTQDKAEFDPERDTIAIRDDLGQWTLLWPDQTLAESARTISTELGVVTEVFVRARRAKQCLFLKGRRVDNPDAGFTVMVNLREVQPGRWMMDDIFHQCTGISCTQCGFVDYMGCACERYDMPSDDLASSECWHRVSKAPGLARVPVVK
jgi:hypothetical protein